jgi:hypothetical protein
VKRKKVIFDDWMEKLFQFREHTSLTYPFFCVHYVLNTQFTHILACSHYSDFAAANFFLPFLRYSTHLLSILFAKGYFFLPAQAEKKAKCKENSHLSKALLTLMTVDDNDTMMTTYGKSSFSWLKQFLSVQAFASSTYTSLWMCVWHYTTKFPLFLEKQKTEQQQ